MINIIYLNIYIRNIYFNGFKGSDMYLGKWKAINSEGKRTEIEFTANQMIINNKSGKSSVWEYSQNSINIEYGITNYKIVLENGLSCKIILLGDNKEKGVITDQNDQVMYIIGRNVSYLHLPRCFWCKLKSFKTTKKLIYIIHKSSEVINIQGTFKIIKVCDLLI